MTTVETNRLLLRAVVAGRAPWMSPAVPVVWYAIDRTEWERGRRRPG